PTWRRPSCVWAWSAKMSRMSRLRSMTLTFSRLSSAFCWPGESSSSATSRLKPVSLLAWPSSSALPLPTYQFGSTWRRFCHSAPTTSAPAVVARLASSVSESSALQPVSSPVSTATRNAFSTGGVRSMAVWRGTAEGYRASRGGSAGEGSRGGTGRLDRWSGGRVQPVDPGLGPEPGPLALRERLVAAGALWDRGVPSQLAVQDGPCLAVADRREGRQPRVAVLPERPGLLQQARLELAPGPGGDP